MTVEYLVLGIVLILMGGVQVWLRHGPGSKEDRRQAKVELGGEEARRGVLPPSGGGRIRSGRVWEAWTALLGFVGMGLGIALVVMGVLGK
jgi:hypothetical protein